MFDSIIGASITVSGFLICVVTAIVLGVIVALLHMFTSNSNKNFINTLAILPAIVATVILLVNGNLGTSVAIVGAFSLIRFRSIPGNSREIMNVFFAMAIGLAVGTGYIAFAVLFTLLIGIISFFLYRVNFGDRKQKEKYLTILVPEDLDYTTEFDDLFKSKLSKYDLVRTKTTNLGSMFELRYNVILKENVNEKELIDKIRVRNGNLKVSLSHPIESEEL